LTVSNQGFTIHNHICGINFLSHLRGAPQTPGEIGMPWIVREGCGIAVIVDIARESEIGRKKKPPARSQQAA